MIVLDRCHDLAVHRDIKTGVVVLEYASEGRVVSTGAPYTNRYISVLTITDRKVTHWRRLPRPRGGLRRARVAVTLMDGACSGDSDFHRPLLTGTRPSLGLLLVRWPTSGDGRGDSLGAGR
jgi:hypothetical protein